MYCTLALISLYLVAVRAQQVGTQTAEVHPSLPWQKCTKSGGCVTQSSGKVVLDANWRWVHTTSGYTNCYTGQKWDSSICSDPVTCAKNCAVDGADYSGTYGITTSGNALTLKFVTKGSGTNVGSRVYMMASDDTNYEMFKLKNQEFTFDVDVSNLPCGLNGALYFSEMAADGGMSKYPNNKAGAKYGTGYCDAQCPKDIKFINGEANSGGWTGSSNDLNSGTGSYGTCCNEMDVWEANSVATAYTPHPCSVTGQTRCSGSECTSFCDQPGCDFNSFRMGDKSFYGKGLTVDTSKKMTVVTQFITADGTASGALTEIRRIYVQNGKVIQNSKTAIPGMAAYDSITDKFCSAQKTAFNDQNVFATKGGLATMDKSFSAGVVLVMSIWDDHAANMLWLDSNYPVEGNPSTPGIARGTCATTSGKPTDVETNSPNASVTYSNIRFGDIGSTFSGSGTITTTTGPSTTSTSIKTTSTTIKTTSTFAKATTTKTTSAPATTSSAPSGAAPHYGQCGGVGFSGPKTCAAPYKCVKSNDYYSQCL
ncbi:Exoglucanase 1 [Ceratobasidium sp. 395]|nr:Exoglucanase 1 [Ceratobasidium sp. 395]